MLNLVLWDGGSHLFVDWWASLANQSWPLFSFILTLFFHSAYSLMALNDHTAIEQHMFSWILEVMHRDQLRKSWIPWRWVRNISSPQWAQWLAWLAKLTLHHVCMCVSTPVSKGTWSHCSCFPLVNSYCCRTLPVRSSQGWFRRFRFERCRLAIQ